MKISNIKRMTLSALCVALCVVLPIAFHVIPNAGAVLLPMHIPVLLCGLVCGWQYGLLCGILGPLVSSVLTGMPPAAILPGISVQLIMLPTLVVALNRAGLVPFRYAAQPMR